MSPPSSAAPSFLVEHASVSNLGDAAMMHGAVSALRKRFPDARLHLVGMPRWIPGAADSSRAFALRLPSLLRTPEIHDEPSGAPSVVQKLARGVLGSAWGWPVASAASTLLRLECKRLLRDPARAAARTTVTLGSGDERETIPLPALAARHDALVICGRPFSDDFPNTVAARCLLAEAFRMAGKPVAVLGQQIGPFRSPRLGRAALGCLTRAGGVGVRDALSMEVAASLGADVSRLALTGDGSIGMEPAPAGEVLGALSACGLKAGEFIAVNVRVGFYARSTRSALPRLAAMLGEVARRSGLGLLFVPVAFDAVDSDVRSGEALAALLPGGLLRTLPADRWSPRLAKGVAGAARIVVSQSYHCCLFALTLGVPAVQITEGSQYGFKGRALVRHWGDARLALPLDACAEGADRVLSLMEDADLRAALRARMEEDVRRREQGLDRLFSPFA